MPAGGGALSLPAWVSAYAPTLAGECGLEQGAYSFRPSEPAGVNWTASADLLAPVVLRLHMAHLLQDVVHYPLGLAGVLGTPNLGAARCGRASWRGRLGRRGCGLGVPGGAPRASLRPALLLPPPLAIDPDSPAAANVGGANADWGRRLLRLASSAYPAGLTLLDAAAPGGRCFRSAFVFGGGRGEVGQDALGADNPFWAAASFNRTPRPSPGTACATIRYTLLNRLDSRRLPRAETVADGIAVLTGRAGAGGTAAAGAAAAAAANAAAAKAKAAAVVKAAARGTAAATAAAAAAEAAAPPPPPPPVTVVAFDGTPRTPFSSQRALLAATSVLIAAHGAGLSNILFLRPGSIVIEVFPFGYTPHIFEELAAQLGIVHIGIMAAPDGQGVADCLRAAHGGAGASTAAEMGLPRVLAEWAAAAAAYPSRMRRGGGPGEVLTGLVPAADDPLQWHGLSAVAPALSSVRPCLRAQPLRLRPEALAMAAVTAAGCRKE